MPPDNTHNGTVLLEQDLRALERLLCLRLQSLRGESAEQDNREVISSIQFASPENSINPYDRFLISKQPGPGERTILLLALIPHLRPDFFESVIFRLFPQGGDLPALGGVKGASHRGMLPTGETAAFLLAGDDLQKRSGIRAFFNPDHFFAKDNILYLEPVNNGEPALSGKIVLTDEYEDYFITGKISRPKFGTGFPAKLLTTKMEWEDLVLPRHTSEQINNIKIWLTYNNRLMGDWNMAKRIKPGFRALFHGPSGTGKTLTATLLGKYFEKDVYRVDLSQVVSKYIGETEKNLEKVFARAENKNWILFFDEADALFGKRTTVHDSHDRYANQEVAYLLQRVEDYPGLIILASNFKNNIDSAFARRFNAVIHFPLPSAGERIRLWEKAIPQSLKADFDCKQLADKYEITGATVMNVVHYAALKAVAENSGLMRLQDILEAIRNEFHKEDKFF